MAHPRIGRSLAAAGMTAALLTLPLAGSGWALGLDDAPVATDALPAPVADAVDEAAAPIKEAVAPAAPVVEQIVEAVVEAAPAPVRDAAKVVPAAPSAPVAPAPVPAAPAAPRGTWTAPVNDAGGPPAVAPAAGPAAGPAAAAAAPDDGFARARRALLSQPMSTTPFPQISELLGAESPLFAADVAGSGASTTRAARDGASPWLVATATGMLVLLGAAHIAYADGRLSRPTA